MKPHERLILRIAHIAKGLNELAAELTVLAENIQDHVQKDEVARAVIEQRYGEARLKDGPRRVLEWIRKRKVVTQTEISQRFSRTFTGAQLHGPGAIMEELLNDRLVEKKLVPGHGRTAIVYTIPVTVGLKAHALEKGEMIVPPRTIDEVLSPVIKEASEIMAGINWDMAYDTSNPEDDQRVADALKEIDSFDFEAEIEKDFGTSGSYRGDQ